MRKSNSSGLIQATKKRAAGKNRECGRKTRGGVRGGVRGVRVVRNGGQRPSFLLRRGELLHSSDLVQQLCDEVLQGEEHIIITRKDSVGWREVNGAGLTSVGLKQSTSKSCKKQRHNKQCESNTRQVHV